MNKKIFFSVILSALVLLTWVVSSSNSNSNNDASRMMSVVVPETTTVSDQSPPVDSKAPAKLHSQHSHNSSTKNDSAVFDFTPYVTPEMAEEIRPYTSRKSSDLVIKIDAEGREYVDLKKRWSHATIVVKDKEGNKHSGDWAPE